MQSGRSSPRILLLTFLRMSLVGYLFIQAATLSFLGMERALLLRRASSSSSSAPLADTEFSLAYWLLSSRGQSGETPTTGGQAALRRSAAPPPPTEEADTGRSLMTDLSASPPQRHSKHTPWSWEIPFVLTVVKDARPMASWLHLAWTLQYQVDLTQNRIWYQGVSYPRDMNLPEEEQKLSIPKNWVNERFSLPDRLRQIQQGRDQLAVLKLLWQHETGYCYRPTTKNDANNKNEPYDPNQDERVFFFAEDDWDLCGQSMSELDAILDWALQNKSRWTGIRFARGNGAMLLQCRDLPLLTKSLEDRIGIPGIDWSVDKFLQKYQPAWGLQTIPSDVGQNSNPTAPETLPRLYRVAGQSLFRHNDGGVSTIWTEKGFEEAITNRGEAGCDEMKTKVTWYTGFNYKKCSQKDDRFLVSPCWDNDLSPIPTLKEISKSSSSSN